MSVYSNLYKGAAKKNEAKQKKTQSYVTNLGKQTYKKWKTGGNETSNARKTYLTQQSKRRAIQGAKNAQKSPRSTFTKVIDALNAPSAATSQTLYDIATGKSKNIKDVASSFATGFNNAWSGSKYNSNTDTIKYMQQKAKSKGEVSLWDRIYATTSGGYVKNGKTYYGSGKEITEDDSRMQISRTMTGMAADVVLDPTGLLLQPLQVGKTVLKGSGASLKSWELATQALKATGELAENGVKAEQLRHRAATVKKLWGSAKENKTAILTGVSKERVANNLRDMPSLQDIDGAELDQIAADTVNSFQKNVMHANTAADELRAKVCGYGNTSYDKARRLIQNQNLKVMEGLQKVGDYTVSPYYNSLTEKLRTSRAAQMFSNASKTEDMVKSNLLGYGAKKSGGTQIEADVYATKQALESGRIQAVMENKALEVAQHIRSLVGDMDAEEQLKLLKSIENGDMKMAKRLFGKFIDSNAQPVDETVEQFLQASETEFQKMLDLTKEAIKSTEKAKFTPQQYFYYTVYNRMPGAGDDDAILDALKVMDLDDQFENLDLQATFGRMVETMRRRTGEIKVGSEDIYLERDIVDLGEWMEKQLEMSNIDLGAMLDKFMNTVGLRDAEKMFKDNAVFKTDEIKNMVKAAEQVGDSKVTVKFFGGTAQEKLVLRATRDTKKGGALETAYYAIKKSALDARNAGMSPQMYKDAEDLITLVESTAKARGGDVNKALEELAPSLKKNMIDSYASTAEGYEDLFGRVRGKSAFEKAREYARARGAEDMEDITTFMSEEQKVFMKDFQRAMDLLHGTKNEFRLGKGYQQNLAMMEKMEEAMKKAKEVGDYFGSEDTVEFVLADLFNKEMSKIINKEMSMGRWGNKATKAFMERGGTDRYVPHIQSDAYKQTMKTAEKKEGTYSSIYSSIGNPWSKPYPIDEAIDSTVRLDTGEEIAKLKQNITEIYLDRALHSNTLLYGDDARRFLYHYATNPLKVDTLNELLQKFDNMPEGTKIGVTYESVKNAMTKAINEDIDEEAAAAVKAMLDEKFGQEMDVYVEAMRKVDDAIRNQKDNERFVRARQEALKDAPPMGSRNELGDELMKDLTYKMEERNTAIDVTNELEGPAAFEKMGSTMGDIMDLNGDDAVKIMDRMRIEQQLRQWQFDIQDYTMEMHELQKSMADTLGQIKEISQKEFVTPLDEDIKKMVEQLNVLRDVDASYSDVSQTMEQAKRMLEAREAYLIEMDGDYSYMRQLYNDFEQIQKDYQRALSDKKDLEFLMDYARGSDQQEIIDRLVESWKRTNYQDMYDAKLEQVLNVIFRGDTERIQSFAGNIPLQELTKEQAQTIAGLFGNKLEWFDASEQLLGDVNKATRSQQIAHQSAFMRAYDWWMMRYKMANTVTSPGFHWNNALSNEWQAYMRNGSRSLNVGMRKVSRDILKGQNPNKTIELGGKTYTYRELHSLMTRTGVVSETFGAWDLGADITAKRNNIMAYAETKGGDISLPSSLNKVFGGAGKRIDDYKTAMGEATSLKDKARETVELAEDALTKPSSNIGQQLEATQRSTMFLACLKEGKNPTQALDEVNKYLFDYGNLTDFEKNVVRRVIPFYTFMRKNIPMHLDTLINNPRRMSIFSKMMETADNDDDTMLPNNRRNIWTQQYMQIPGTNIGIDWKLPIEAAFQRPFDWTVKDMASEDYGKVTPASALNTATSLINNPILNSIYTMATGSSPAIYNAQDIDTSAMGRVGKTVKGLSGTWGSFMMESAEYSSDLAKAKEAVANAKTQRQKEKAQKELKKAQKNYVKTISKYFANPVDIDMYDYQNWKKYDVEYKDYKTGESMGTFPSYLSQEELEQNYQDNWGKITLEDNKKKAAYANEVYRQQAEDFKGRYLEGQTHQEYLENTFHVKDNWEFQKQAGITKLSYEKWLKKYYGI